MYFSFCCLSLYILFFFRAVPAACGSSQARGQIGAAAASLHHSHSNIRSRPHLQPTPQLMAIPVDPLSEARDQTHILMDTNQILNLLNHNGNSLLVYFILQMGTEHKNIKNDFLISPLKGILSFFLICDGYF